VKNTKNHGFQTAKSKAETNKLTHLQTLEGNYGIPQNKGHPARAAAAWTPRLKKHPDLHQLRNALFQNVDDEFHVKVAHNMDEACKLLEVGFEYVTDMDEAKLFRKRK